MRRNVVLGLDGVVDSVGSAWTQANCRELVASRAADGYYAAELIEKDEIFSPEQIKFSAQVLNENIVARRIQYCFARARETAE